MFQGGVVEFKRDTDTGINVLHEGLTRLVTVKAGGRVP